MKSTKGTTSGSGAKPQQPRTWIKNHPLEGDGLVTGFYNFLHKRNAKTMKACKDVLIPDTIVFDHNFPRGWYTSDMKSREISKRQGKELDAASISKGFEKPAGNGVPIVASYMSSTEVDDPATGETTTVTNVEFFNEHNIGDFVARKTKREGILQKFLAPKGLRNTVIQAVWSPRVCIVQRRTNRNQVKDKLQCERDPYPIAVTYEGPSHYSEEGTCAGHTTEQVKELCTNIVQHFHATEHKFITRMVLYFKVDHRDQLWLLWCGSLRVSDKDTPSQMALNLAPRFDSPSLEAGSPAKEEKDLHEADLRHLAMTNDTMFYANYVKPALAGSPRNGAGDTMSGGHGRNDGEGGHGGDVTPRARAQAAAKARADAAVKAADLAKTGGIAVGPNDTWHLLPGIREQYQELLRDRDTVLSAMEDTFYEAYGHFLNHNPGPFDFTVDRGVAQTLGVDVLQELMTSVRIEHAVPSDDAGAGGATVDDEELCYTVPAARQNPVKQLGDNVRRWVSQHYERRLLDLKEEAASMPPAQLDDDVPPPSAQVASAPPSRPAAQEEKPEEKVEEKDEPEPEPEPNDDEPETKDEVESKEGSYDGDRKAGEDDHNEEEEHPETPEDHYDEDNGPYEEKDE